MLCWVSIWLLGVLGISSIRSSSPSCAELTDCYNNLLRCVTREHRYDAPADTGSLLDTGQNSMQGWEVAAQNMSATVRETCASWPQQLTWFWIARAQSRRLPHCLCSIVGMPTVQVDPYGRPPLPRRRPEGQTVTHRTPPPRRRVVKLRPAVEANATAAEDQPTSCKRTAQEQLAEAVELLDRSRRRLRIPGSIGRAARAESKLPEGGVARKVKPSLKLSEAPRSSKCKTARTKASSRAVAAVGDQGRPQETASSSRSAAAKMKTKPVVAPVKKTVLGMTPKAKPAAAVQSTVELDDDSYEYYTSTSESQDIVQIPLQKPDSRARAEYIAGCIVLLSAWCTVVGAKRPDGLDYVQYCLVQVFPGIMWSATQRSRIVWGLRVWIQRAIKGSLQAGLAADGDRYLL